MKKIDITFIKEFILYSFSYAQDYNTGIRLHAGCSYGLSIKHFVGEKKAMEGLFSSRW